MSWKLPAPRPGRAASPELVARRAAAGSLPGQPSEPGAKVDIDEESIGGVPCTVCRPAGATATVLYLHGGGYRLGAARSWAGFATRLGVEGECTVVLPDYRLAPEHPFPAALLDAAAVYEALVAAGPVLVAGDSAGGGLAVALAATSAGAGGPVPAGLVTLSPWVDLTIQSDTFTTRAATDELFPRAAAQEAADAYLQGLDPREPLASPLFADLSGLPPTLVLAGESETLLGDSLNLVARLADAGVSVEAHVVAGMQHVWPMIFPDLPESAEAVRTIGRFIAKAADGAAGSNPDPDRRRRN